MDREFRHQDATDGERKQTWHYPSRTECMVCHSRAANWVLGLSELQMSCQSARHAATPGASVQLGRRRQTERREQAKADGKKDKEIQAYLERQRSRGRAAESGKTLLFPRPLEIYERLVDPYDPKLEACISGAFVSAPQLRPVPCGRGGRQFADSVEFRTSLEK